MGGLPGVHAMWAGADWRWHRVVPRNTEVHTEAWLKDLVLHETRFAGRAVQQIYHVDFYDGEGNLLCGADSWCFRTERDAAREQGTKYAEVRQRGERRYTGEELDEVFRRYAGERARGAEPRRFADVAVGDTLPPMLKGPMTVTGFICYAQGWGGLYIRANRLAWRQIARHSGLGIANRFGIPDCPERVHWEDEFAVEVGAPGAYDYGPERCSWMIHQLTDWMGDDGFVESSYCEIRRHNPVGDTPPPRGGGDGQDPGRGRWGYGPHRAAGAQPGRRALGAGHRRGAPSRVTLGGHRLTCLRFTQNRESGKMQIVVEWKTLGISEYLEIDLENPEKCAKFETRIWCPADGTNCYWKAKSERVEKGDDFYINVKYEDDQEDEKIIKILKNEEDRNAQFGTNKIILERDRRRKVGVKEKGRFEWSADNGETYCGHWRTSDARKRAVGKQLERDKQFRNRILSEDRKCVITGETFEAVLDAAHICPVKEFDNDGIDNGLVLRADIHRLYDRKVFFIDPRSGKPVIRDSNLPTKYMTLLQNANLPKKSLERVKRSLWNRWNDYNRGNNGEGDGAE